MHQFVSHCASLRRHWQCRHRAICRSGLPRVLPILTITDSVPDPRVHWLLPATGHSCAQFCRTSPERAHPAYFFCCLCTSTESVIQYVSMIAVPVALFRNVVRHLSFECQRVFRNAATTSARIRYPESYNVDLSLKIREQSSALQVVTRRARKLACIGSSRRHRRLFPSHTPLPASLTARTQLRATQCTAITAGAGRFGAGAPTPRPTTGKRSHAPASRHGPPALRYSPLELVVRQQCTAGSSAVPVGSASAMHGVGRRRGVKCGTRAS